MAVIDQDTFSNISWNSDQRTDDEGVIANDNNDNSSAAYDASASKTKNSSNVSRSRMADDDFEQPLLAGGDARQKETQKQKQKQTASSSSRGGGSLGAGEINYDEHDAAVLGPEILQCRVSSPLTENEGGSNPFTSYLVTTTSTFPTFQKPTVSVRRRFTDFLYLYNSLCRDHPATAVPPIPDKQRMVRVTGDRFGPDFTNRRAYSLQRFLFRLSLHPDLRRAPLLHSFLESGEWNATMRSHSVRVSSADGSGYGAGGGYGGPGGGSSGGGGAGSGGSEQGVTSSMFDAFADSFINVFTKVHRLDRRFVEVREKTDRLDDDLAHVEKVVSRVVRREADLEADLKDLAEQFQKLITLEPGVEDAVRAFAASVEDTAAGLRGLRDITDQDYLSSLRDMVAYSGSLKNLLKAREQKQLDFEQLTEYLNKNTADRDHLAQTSGGYYHSGLSTGGGSSTRRDSSSGAGGSGSLGESSVGGGGGGAAGGAGSSHAGGSASAGGGVASYVTSSGGGALAGASGFLRSKLEDVRGVDHEQSRRERQRKLELRVEELTTEVERAKKTSELFDEEVVKEVAYFERIKRTEFKKQLGGLADAHIAYYDAVAGVWEAYVREMEKDGVLAV
ncbi:sorting nexin-4 [Sporothrix schenckii ATCC 58251]|uniref:Sorting nexin-4 n=1 Tax=Sporothrix schenckii (strain ATCC 58251 / de Perez 2211183) TaxID=1391915 RepID=U7PXF2_SPOS1|nr:sorting nexin-4 [Sporothrix schenckii ATCC 58251]